MRKFLQFEDEGVYSVVAVAEGAPVPLGTRVTYDPGCIADIVQRTGGPARIDDYTRVPSASLAHQLELCGAVGTAVVVDGQLWGVILAMSTESPLPPGTEHLLGQFADLVGAAIANASTRAELRQLADEQSSLRRVAELVARGAPPEEIFATVASESAALMNADVMLTRYQGDAGYSVVAGSGDPASAGARAFDPGDLTDLVRRTGEPVRIDQQDEFPDALIAHRLQLRGAVGAAITVDDGPTALVRESLRHVESASAELRDLVHGILPPALVNGGLGVGVEALAARCPLPVDIRVNVPRLAPEVETTAFSSSRRP